MKQITIITGKQGSGKTTTAKKMAHGKKQVWIDASDLGHGYGFKDVKEDTDVIIIEGVSVAESLKLLITATQIAVNRRQYETMILPKPKIIITSNTLTKSDFPTRAHKIDFIEL